MILTVLPVASISLVVGTPTPLSLTVTLNRQGDPPDYKNGEVVQIMALVTNYTNPVEEAAVDFQFTTAKGGPLNCHINTNNAGQATCSYRVKAKRGHGE